MSSGTFGFSIAQLEGKIAYPPFKKKVISQEPHRSAESKRLVEQYKAAVAAEALERQRYAVAAGSGVAAAQSLTTSTKKSLTATKLSATPNPSNLISAAESAEENGRMDDAIGCLLEALRLCNISYGSPLSGLAAEINERLGMHHIDKEMYPEAIGYFTAGVEVEPTFSRNYLHRAECYVLLDDPKKAFDEYEKYFKLEPPTKSQLVRCGKCALDADLLDEAKHYLEQTIAHPGTAAAAASGDDGPSSSPAAAAKQEEVSDASNNAYAYYNLGELEEKKLNDTAAREYFAKVSQADPQFFVPYEIQAEEEYSKCNYTMALHLFESLAKILPDAPRCFVRLADVFEHLGEEFVSSVLACLTRALELKQERRDKENTLVRRGKLLFEQFQKLEEALADFTLCLSLNPSNHEALNSRALVYRAREFPGDGDAAVADYRVLVGLDCVPLSTKAEPHVYLANNAFQTEDYATAAKYFSLAQLYDVIVSTTDVLRMQIACAAVAIKQGDTFDELYEPRGWPSRDAEKGKKADPSAGKGSPVVSLSYWLIDQWYTTLRDREPTMHNALEYQFIALWKPFREEVERKREDAEALRLGKKPKKGGK